MTDSNLPEWLFRLRHAIHGVSVANSSVGPVSYCYFCDVVNYPRKVEAGRRSHFKTEEEWAAFHEAHGGEIKNYGGGTVSDFYCTKCGASN